MSRYHYLFYGYTLAAMILVGNCILSQLFFFVSKVPVIREITRSLNVSDKGSRVDIVTRLKKALNLDQAFLKLFAKLWGGSGVNCVAS